MEFISYDEMLELASVGAGVMHSRSIEFAKKFDVPVQVRSSFSDVEGTWIVPETDWMKEVKVCGAALQRDEARINIEGVPDKPGISHRIFSSLADQNIAVDMIAQNVGREGRAAIGFTVPRNELPTAVAVLHPLARDLGATVEYEDSVGKVSVVGTGMRTQTGVAERMFAALAEAQIAMKMITTSDIKISVLVDRADALNALRAVHQVFRLHEARPGAGMPEKTGTSPLQPHTSHAPSNGREWARLSQQLSSMEEIVISEVLLNSDQGRITIANLPNRPGHCSQVFQAVAEGGILVDMIVQNLTGPGLAQLSFSVPIQDLDKARRRTEEVVRALDAQTTVTADPDIATLYVLGVGMRTHTGVARRMFGALAERGINISMINTSEVRISVVVDRDRGDEALTCLKEAFRVQ
jgi:aspartate kinase